MRVYLAIVTLLWFIAGTPAAFAAKVCTQDEAHRAEDDAVRIGAPETLKGWAQVYRSFRLYGHCDDGAIAEAYSDAIAMRLAGNWRSVSELLHYTRMNRGFEHFIIRHVDTLMTPEQGKAIMTNARKKCPADALQLCKHIIDSIRSETNQR